MTTCKPKLDPLYNNIKAIGALNIELVQQAGLLFKLMVSWLSKKHRFHDFFAAIFRETSLVFDFVADKTLILVF
jgi:hypothetical protein